MTTAGLQLLSFDLGDDHYAIDIGKVQEIRAVGKLRRLPHAPSHCVGVIDFRDHIVPVMDLRHLFDYPNTTIDTQTVMVIVSIDYQNEAMLLGLIVDQVSDVISIQADELRPSPNFAGKLDTGFMLGMFKRNELIIVVLALDKVFTATDMSAMQAIAKQVVDSAE